MFDRSTTETHAETPTPTKGRFESHRLGTLILSLTLAAVLGLLPASAPRADEATAEQQIETLLLAYADSLDEQAADAAGEALHEAARQFALTPNGFLTLDKETYVGLLAQKKIGGVKSQPAVKRVDIAGPAASAILERPIADRGALFTHFVQLLRVDSSWTVVSVTTSVTPIES